MAIELNGFKAENGGIASFLITTEGESFSGFIQGGELGGIVSYEKTVIKGPTRIRSHPVSGFLYVNVGEEKPFEDTGLTVRGY